MNKFTRFLTSLKNKENQNLLEAITQGYQKIFEARTPEEQEKWLRERKEQQIKRSAERIREEIQKESQKAMRVLGISEEEWNKLPAKDRIELRQEIKYYKEKDDDWA